MNGKLYTQNLATVANFDGADAVAADGENRILVKWATALTGENQSGENYWLWVIILDAKGGDNLNGLPLQFIVLSVMQIITGDSLPSGWSIPELVAFGADNGGTPPPPTGCFTLIGSSECFTLIGSAEEFTLIP